MLEDVPASVNEIGCPRIESRADPLRDEEDHWNLFARYLTGEWRGAFSEKSRVRPLWAEVTTVA